MDALTFFGLFEFENGLMDDGLKVGDFVSTWHEIRFLVDGSLKFGLTVWKFFFTCV